MKDILREFRASRITKDSPGKAPRASEVVPPEDFVRMKEWIRQAHSEAERARILEEQEPENFNNR